MRFNIGGGEHFHQIWSDTLMVDELLLTLLLKLSWKKNKMATIKYRWRQITAAQLLAAAISFLTCFLSVHCHRSLNADIQCCQPRLVWARQGRVVLIWLAAIKSSTTSQRNPKTNDTNSLSNVRQIYMIHWPQSSSPELPQSSSTPLPPNPTTTENDPLSRVSQIYMIHWPQSSSSELPQSSATPLPLNPTTTENDPLSKVSQIYMIHWPQSSSTPTLSTWVSTGFHC